MSLCNIFLATGVEFITKDPLLKTYLGRSCRFHMTLTRAWPGGSVLVCRGMTIRVKLFRTILAACRGDDFWKWVYSFGRFARKSCTKITKVCGLSGRTLLTLISFIHADSINTVQLGIDRHGCLLMLKSISCQYSDPAWSFSIMILLYSLFWY